MKPMVEGPWVARLPMTVLAALDRLRLQPGLEVCVEGDHCWVRSRTATLPVDVPWHDVFAWDEADELYPPAHQLPARRLPVGDWQPIAAQRPIHPVATGLPAGSIRRVPLTLVPDGGFREADLLRTTLQEWAGWARDAAAVRLQCLHFAVLENDIAFVRGNPLPPIPGRRFVGSENVFIPAGARLGVPVSMGTIRNVLALGERESAVFDSAEEWVRIPPEVWLPAGRALIRASMEEAGR